MRRFATVAILVVGLASARAHAAPPGGKADPRFAARALAEHGQGLYDAGRYAEALPVFEQADRLYHAPTLVLAIGKSYAAMGKLVEARARFQRIVDEPIKAGAPRVFQEALAAARAQLAEIDRKIPALQIHVRGGGGTALKVSVDDREIADWTPERFVMLDPGTHRVSVVPTGGVGRTTSVELREGARLTVTLELSGSAPAVVRSPPPPPEPRPAPWRWPSYVLFGVGAAGLGLGVGAGIATLNKASSLREACPSGTCPTRAHDAEIDAANALGVASTAGFVLAGAGAAAGLLLWFLPSRARGAPEVSVGPLGIDVRGVF
jgi:tetratricopeptide (TPR) repeat protein